MSTIQACILGIIQGVTEFLPVSSTAHLTIIPPLLGFEYQGRAVDVFLNLGTLLAIMIFFYRDIFHLFCGAFDFICTKKSVNRDYFITITLASLPTIIIGGVAEMIFDINTDSALILSINLILFGFILYLCDMRKEEKVKVSRFHAVLVGCAQTLAIIPGVSRLGACLSMSRFLKYSEWSAFKFSMILSLPAVAGACTLKLLKVFTGKITIDNWTFVLVGATCALICGLITLRAMQEFLRKHNFRIFAVYRIIFGAVLLITLCVK